MPFAGEFTDRLDRYQQKALVAAFRNIPDFAMCLGSGCESGQIHVGGDGNPIMTCTTCHFKTCFTHKMPWHTGQTCSEYDELQKERMEQEAASKKFIADTAKICPNPSCGYAITKTVGCDHMTCKNIQMYLFGYIDLLNNFRQSMRLRVLLYLPRFLRPY